MWLFRFMCTNRLMWVFSIARIGNVQDEMDSLARSIRRHLSLFRLVAFMAWLIAWTSYNWQSSNQSTAEARPVISSLSQRTYLWFLMLFRGLFFRGTNTWKPLKVGIEYLALKMDNEVAPPQDTGAVFLRFIVVFFLLLVIEIVFISIHFQSCARSSRPWRSTWQKTVPTSRIWWKNAKSTTSSSFFSAGATFTSTTKIASPQNVWSSVCWRPRRRSKWRRRLLLKTRCSRRSSGPRPSLRHSCSSSSSNSNNNNSNNIKLHPCLALIRSSLLTVNIMTRRSCKIILVHRFRTARRKVHRS